MNEDEKLICIFPALSGRNLTVEDMDLEAAASEFVSVQNKGKQVPRIYYLTPDGHKPSTQSRGGLGDAAAAAPENRARPEKPPALL